MQMPATDGGLTVLEKCRVSPPPNTVGERSLPLTAFDMPWLLFHGVVHNLFFYDFPHSKSHFVETIVPKLKHSLSITLQHFFPFAGNIVVFPSEKHSGVVRKPEVLHVDGDSVALTFAKSGMDFHDLKGNHPRDCNKFYPLIPQLESAFKASSFLKIPVFSIQVTIFPNSGITIGVSYHHALCDARTQHNFLMGWTSIAKYGNDELFLASQSLPFYGRVINYPNSIDEVLLNFPAFRAIDENYKVPQLLHQTDRLRSTIVFTQSQISCLKKWLLLQLPTLKYVSSFAVGCGYVWSCIAKSRILIEGKKGEYEVERFCCMADWRTRLDPPVPLAYFGNCLGDCLATTKTTLLTGSNGFPSAVEAIGTAIMEAVNRQEFFKHMETSWKNGLVQVPTLGVTGTPKHNVYDLDFGWGRPKKYETISDAISVNVSKESSHDLEIGVSLPTKQMDAFMTIFRKELESILSVMVQ